MDPCTTPRARWRESKREKREERLECRQATRHLLHLFTFATTRHPRGEPPTLFLHGEAISPSTSVITSTNIQDIVFRDRTLEVVENANSMESRPANTVSKKQAPSFAFETRGLSRGSELPSASLPLTIPVGSSSSLGPSTS